MRSVATHYCYYIFSHEWMNECIWMCECVLSVSMPNTKTKPKQYNKMLPTTQAYSLIHTRRVSEWERDGQLITIIAIIYCESIAASCLDVVRRSLLLYFYMHVSIRLPPSRSLIWIRVCICEQFFSFWYVYGQFWTRFDCECNQTLWLASKQINRKFETPNNNYNAELHQYIYNIIGVITWHVCKKIRNYFLLKCLTFVQKIRLRFGYCSSKWVLCLFCVLVWKRFIAFNSLKEF